MKLCTIILLLLLMWSNIYKPWLFFRFYIKTGFLSPSQTMKTSDDVSVEAHSDGRFQKSSKSLIIEANVCFEMCLSASWALSESWLRRRWQTEIETGCKILLTGEAARCSAPEVFWQAILMLTVLRGRLDVVHMSRLREGVCWGGGGEASWERVGG